MVRTTSGDVRIHRVHLEEDTGKLLHTRINDEDITLVDFNRSGVPLVEIVTEPDIHSGDQAKEFLKKLHQIIRYLGISDADMEKGSMRLEPNISLQQILHEDSKSDKNELPAYKVEVKNINSFNFVKKAIEYEAERQKEILQNGKIPVQETRGWNAQKGITVSQRVKETADDYRYFPEPDIPPIRFSEEYIQTLKAGLPELPHEKELRFAETYGLNLYDSGILTETPAIADYFEEAISDALKTAPAITAKHIANWIINRKMDWEHGTPATLVKRIKEASLASSLSSPELSSYTAQAIADNPKAVADYKAGKEQALMFILGSVMRTAKGKADAKAAKEEIVKQIQEKQSL